jgi:hypothetical protein
VDSTNPVLFFRTVFHADLSATTAALHETQHPSRVQRDVAPTHRVAAITGVRRCRHPLPRSSLTPHAPRNGRHAPHGGRDVARGE